MKQTPKELGESIAKELDVYFNGVWPELNALAFTDKQTRSTFTAHNLEDARTRLVAMRKEFEPKKEVNTCTY